MAASDETCEGNPNFAIICSFITKFGDECGVNVSIPYLQQMLEDTKNVHQDLLEIILHLMRRGKKRFNKDKWEKCLVKFCHEYSSVDAWEIERFGFIKSKLSVKLEIFKRLLELQFDANAKFKGEVNKLDASSLRILPLGKDIDGHAYWYQLDKDYNMRLYRETFNEEDNSWQLLCSTTDDLKNLIVNLEKKYSSPNAESCKDDPYDLKDPKTPPPDMPLPKRENDSEEMTSHLSESKPCTIIIKTEKKESVSHTETSIKTEGCAKTDNKSKKPDDSVLETKSKEVVSMDLSHSSENEDKSILDSKDLSEKSVISASDTEPMEVEIIKPTEKDSEICDIEMKSVEDVSPETRPVKLNEEHLDQNTTDKSKSSLPTEQTDSINHHKSSKIKLYEKWSNEKKKSENVNANNLETDKTPKRSENSESKVTDSNKPPECLEMPEEITRESNKTSEPSKKIETSIVKSDKCSIILEEKKSISESSESSKDVSDKTEQSNSTVEKKKGSSAQIEISSKQSINQVSNLEKSCDNSDSEQMAVDLSKTSRVNVIVQNASSKPSLSNCAKSDSRKSENNLCTNKMNSDSVEVVKKHEPVVLPMNKSQETAMDLKCTPYSVDSDKMYKSNQTFSKSYDVSVITNASSKSGFSHLQALQNMCESNIMGGIPSVIHSTNQCKPESNKTEVSKNSLNSSTDYVDISKKYNFNDVHCVNDKIGSKNQDASSVLLKANVHEPKHSEEIKKDNSLSKNSLSNSNISKNEGNESNKPQLFPTDLSCPSVIKSNDNEPKVVSSVCTDKKKSSDVLKEQPDFSKKLVESGKDKSSKEKCGVQADDTVKLDSSIINDLSQNKDSREKKDPKTVEEKNVDKCTKKCSKSVIENSDLNNCATDLSISHSLQTSLSHTDKHSPDCELVDKSIDNSKSLTQAVSLSADSCDTSNKNVVKDPLCTEKESNLVVSESKSNEDSKISDEIPLSESKNSFHAKKEPDLVVSQTESKEASKTTDAIPQSGSKETSKTTDAIPQSGSKETSKTTDAIPQSGSKETSKTTDAIPQSGSKETSKTTDAIPQSGSKETSKTTGAIPQSGSKETSKATDAIPQSGSKETSKTTDAIPQSRSKETSKTTDAMPQSGSKETSKTTDAIPQSRSKETSKTTDAIPQSGSKETSKTTDAIPQSGSKETSKTTDAIPQSRSKETSKTTDAIPQSGSKETSKTTDAIPQSESKETSKTTDAIPQSGSKETSKTTDAIPQSGSKETSKTTDAIPQSGSKETSKTTDEVPQIKPKDSLSTKKGRNLEILQSESKEVDKTSDTISQSGVKEKSKASAEVSQPEVNETNRSAGKESQTKSDVKNKISVDRKEISDIEDCSLIKSAAEVKGSEKLSSESKKSEDECPRLKKPDESDSDSKESEAEPPHLKEPSELESELSQNDIEPPNLKACSKSNAELKQTNSEPKSAKLDSKCETSKIEETITKEPPPNSIESKSCESSMPEKDSNSVSLSRECEMPSLLDQQKKSDSLTLDKSIEEPSNIHEMKNTVPETTNDRVVDRSCPKDSTSTKCTEQKSEMSYEVEPANISVKQKNKESIENESAKSPESNDKKEKASEIDNSCENEKGVSNEQILSSNEESGLEKLDADEDKNISDSSTPVSKKKDLPSKSSTEKSKETKKVKECVQNDAPNHNKTKCNNLEVNENSEAFRIDEEKLSLQKSVCDDESDVQKKNAEAEKKCEKQSSSNAKVDLQDGTEKVKSPKVKDSKENCSDMSKDINAVDSESNIESVKKENTIEKKGGKIIIEENETVIDEKTNKMSKTPEKVTAEIPISAETDDVSKKKDELSDCVKEVEKENDTKQASSKSKPSKGRPPKKTPARRSRRGGKNLVVEDKDASANCLPADTSKEILSQNEETSDVHKSPESLKVKQISKKELVTETTVIDDNDSSEAMYKLKFKIYDLQLNSCLETKFKHPLWDKYVRCYKSRSSLDQPKDKKSPVKSSPKVKASKQPVVNKKPQTPPKPSPPKKPVLNTPKKPSRNRKSEVSTKENFAIPEGFLEILDKASSKGPPGKRRRNSELLEVASSHNSSENESTPRKRSRRIQEQHQKKITELAVEMEREQRMLEQMAKRSKKNKNSPKPVEKVNIKAVAEKTPTKSNNTPTKSNNTPTKARGKAKIVPPVIVEEVSLDSKRSTRKMNSRSKNLTKITLLYEDESKDSQCSTSRETESKSRRRRRRHGKKKGGFKPWDVSSESSSSTSIEEITEEEVEEPDEPLIFEVNEDEFACEEVDPTAEPVIVKRARTAKKTEIEDASEECINDDTPCQKCGKYDKPEWILLCDKCDKGYHTHCLIPPLMIVPDGDWFCQPCEHMSLCQCLHEELNKLEVILKQKEREALRKQRLAYVGISLDNVLKPEKKEKSDESSKEDKEEEEEEIKEEEEERKVKVKESESRRAAKSRRSEEDERNEILYGKRSVRARRKVNYQFKEYDELIFSALQEDMLEVPEEFKAEAGSDADSDKPFTAKVSTRKKRARRFKDFDSSDEEDSQDDYQGGSSDSEATAPPSDYSGAQSGSDEWKVVKSSGRKKSSQRRTQIRRRRRKRRGGDSSEEDWEDEVVEDEPVRPITRRGAAQKAVSYREISSEEEDEWGAKPKVVNKRHRKSSSSGSEASFKKKVSKKKRVRKWGSSESSEESQEEKSMSSSGESNEESVEQESENEWKIDKVGKEEKTEKKASARKKVLSSDEEEEDDDEDEDDDASSTRESAPKKKPKKVVSESEEEEEEEDEEESESEEEDEEEEEEEEEKQKTVKPSKILHVEDKEKNKNNALEKEVNTSAVISLEKEESTSITENVKFQPKVLVKKELCSVDIPLEPMKPPTPPATPVVDKALPPKPVRKEVTKMVPCVIPHEKLPPKSGQVPAADVIKEDIRRKDEMSYIPPHSRSPMHLSKQSASHIPPSSGDRIHYGGMLPRNTVPPVRHSVNARPQMPAPTNLSVRPPLSSVVVQHPSRLHPRPRSGVPMPPKAPSIPSSLTQTVPSSKSDNKPFKSTIMEPFSSIDDENDSDDEVPLERIPTASTTAPRPVSYERETEYRPAAKELSSYSYAPPEDKSFPGSYSNLSTFPRPSPLKPSLVETYPNNSSPSKLTPLDTYSQSSSPKGFISLDSYSENKKKKHFYGSTSQEGEPPHRPAPENYQGGEIRFPPEPYPCPQSPSSSYPHRSPPTNQRDPGTPPRLYSQFPDAYAPPRSPEYYQNHQYYASEERIPRPSYQPNYAPQDPPSFVSNPYVATPVPQPNGGFMIDTLLQARSHENEEDALTGVTDIVQYITQE